MSANAITAENVSKRYRLGAAARVYGTMLGSLASLLKVPLQNYRRLRGLSRFSADEEAGGDIIWALRGASFEVKHGELIGLVGPNGAGKSTLLKIIARIVAPTGGRVLINGTISSLLEVGTGFHMDLTGRENVYFNGVLLGMSKVEMDRKFDEIVDFSGVERFIDTPVKRYSSGMLVRLAFSVAAHLEPEILLVDEVLAVGDASFQKKCMGKMQEVGRDGRTVVFVSHNLDAVKLLCQRALLVDGGKIQMDGHVEGVVQQYLHSLKFDGPFRYENSDHGLTIRQVVLKNAAGAEVNQFQVSEDLIVDIHYEASRRIERPQFAIAVVSQRGSCFAANMLLDGQRPAALEGAGVISCRFKSLPLLPQNYSLSMAIKSADGKQYLMNYHDVSTFAVTGDLARFGYRGDLSLAPKSTAVVVPYEWTLPDGTVARVSL